MSFTASLSIGQDPLLPNIVVATDDSTGSDSAITQRRIYVQDAGGIYLVPSGTTTDYTQWAIADMSISLNILMQDTAVYVTGQWLDVSNNVLYTYTNFYPLAQYGKNFFYYLIQLQGLTPSIPADTNYDSNCALFWARLSGAINAIQNNSDLAGSQYCFDKTTEMRLNQSKYF